MGKLQSDNKLFVLPRPTALHHNKQEHDAPPQIPPRMKKRGPALPEKPPHIRAKSNPSSSSQTPREPLKPRILNLDVPQATHREVLVAASKSGRERPAEKRQREPAKLLMPTSTGKSLAMPSLHLDETGGPKKNPATVQSKVLVRLEEIRKETMSKNPLWSLEKSTAVRKSRPLQPVLLIPRNLLTWGSTPLVSCALWSQRESGRAAAVIRPIRQSPAIRSSKSETSGTSAVRLRSNSVTRSGSLTSQGSSSSDSGGETFPKSVLKKHRRAAATNVMPRGGSNRKVDQKKNVTFNAFATVQLMEQ